MHKNHVILALLLLAACGDGGEIAGKPGPSAPQDDAGSDVEPGERDGGDAPDAGDPSDPIDSGTQNEDIDAATSSDDASTPFDAGDVETGDAGDQTGDAGDQTGDAGIPDDAGQPDSGPQLTEDEQLAKDYKQKLRSCDVIGSGTFNVGTVEDEFDRCVANCAVDAQCADLKSAMCGTSANESSAYGACAGGCIAALTDDLGGYPSDGFLCDTGDVIPHAAVCDDGLVLDCNAFRLIPRQVSEDEANCLTFTCATGSAEISTRYRCDGLVGVENGGCADESDEAGCASYCAD